MPEIKIEKAPKEEAFKKKGKDLEVKATQIRDRLSKTKSNFINMIILSVVITPIVIFFQPPTFLQLPIEQILAGCLNFLVMSFIAIFIGAAILTLTHRLFRRGWDVISIPSNEEMLFFHLYECSIYTKQYYETKSDSSLKAVKVYLGAAVSDINQISSSMSSIYVKEQEKKLDRLLTEIDTNVFPIIKNQEQEEEVTNFFDEILPHLLSGNIEYDENKITLKKVDQQGIKEAVLSLLDHYKSTNPKIRFVIISILFGTLFYLILIFFSSKGFTSGDIINLILVSLTASGFLHYNDLMK